MSRERTYVITAGYHGVFDADGNPITLGPGDFIKLTDEAAESAGWAKLLTKPVDAAEGPAPEKADPPPPKKEAGEEPKPVAHPGPDDGNGNDPSAGDTSNDPAASDTGTNWPEFLGASNVSKSAARIREIDNLADLAAAQAAEAAGAGRKNVLRALERRSNELAAEGA